MTQQGATINEKQMANKILGAVAEGAGHLFNEDEITWALEITGDLPVVKTSMMVEN